MVCAPQGETVGVGDRGEGSLLWLLWLSLVIRPRGGSVCCYISDFGRQAGQDFSVPEVGVTPGVAHVTPG